MKIRKSKETLILTQSEKAILSKALSILENIYEECERDGEIESYSGGAKDNIGYLLEDVEVEGGEPTGAVRITIMM